MKTNKGIILAGGSGSRLKPTTLGTSKHLLPIYDKPMIYYPISVLMMSGIRELLLISTPDDLEGYKRLLGDGRNFGVNINYQIQPKPEGIAQAFILGEQFIKDDKVALILGDNIFYGQNLKTSLNKVSENEDGATIFCHQVKDPSRFGVVEFNKSFKAVSIEEKPKKPKSNYAVTGLYFYDNRVIEIAKNLSPSDRGELEITDINNAYLGLDKLNVEVLDNNFTWLDTGTYESLMDASRFIQTIESLQDRKVSCLEEIAFNNGWIDKKILLDQIYKLSNTEYGEYLKKYV